MTSRQTTTPLPQLIYPRIIHLRRRLKDLIYKPITGANINVEIGPVHEDFISWEEAINEEHQPIKIGDCFSPASAEKVDGIVEFPWTQRWFRIDVQLPPPSNGKELDGREHEICLLFVAHGEFTAYTNKGDVWCGIDPVHDRIPISKLLEDGERSATIWLDGGKEYIEFFCVLQIYIIFANRYRF